MKNKSSSFKRRKPTLRYKRRYYLVCEGDVTEPDYFNRLKSFYQKSIIDITCLKKQQSAPTYLVKRAIEAQSKLKKEDEIWIILDVDQWTAEQFEELQKWEQQKANRNVAVSNPCFEIWLIFHDQLPKDNSKRACQNYFKKNIAHGNKGIRSNWLTLDKVMDAVKRSKIRDTGDQGIIPNGPTSRIYRLIESIEEFIESASTDETLD